jgi:hypothetical protein
MNCYQDFDLTFISEHTGGRWKGTIPDLATKVRPLFKTLVPIAMRNGLLVAIVTFSPQVECIEGVLRHHFPELAAHIPVRGNDGSWDYVGLGNKLGKQKHMASAAEELNQVNSVNIVRDTTLLIDDDVNNIRIALQNDVRAIRFIPEDPDQ